MYVLTRCAIALCTLVDFTSAAETDPPHDIHGFVEVRHLSKLPRELAKALGRQDCQRSSGTPPASGVVVLASDTEITGMPKTYSVRAGSGRLAIRSFCPDCGAPP